MKDQQQTNQLTKAKSQGLSIQPPKWLQNLGVYTRNDYERSLIAAQADKLIMHYQTKDDYSRLIQMVTKWRIMIGLSKDMSEEELKLNVQFIKNSYGKLTLKEIDLAMNLSLQGQLGVDVEPYGNFSPLYISRILNAYVKKCEEKINEMLVRKRQAEAEAKRNEVDNRTYEEKVESHRSYLTSYANNVRNSDKYFGDFNHWVWNFLNAHNLIDPSDEVLQEAKDFADDEIRRDNQAKGMEKLMRTMGNADQQKEAKKRKEMYGRFYVMRKFFRGLKDVDEFMSQWKPQQLLPAPKK